MIEHRSFFLSRRSFLHAVAAAPLAGRIACTAPAATGGVAPWPLYAFDNGLTSPSVKTVEAKVKLLKDLGYAGIEYHMNHKELPRLLEELTKHGLELFGVYTTPFLEDPIDPKLEGSIKIMAGRPTRIELAIRSRNKAMKPSDPAGDAKAVDRLKRISDMCGDAGPVVSIYPHTWFWTERVDDGVRLAKKTGRKNVGTHFNLVHWRWVKQTRPLEVVLKEALPHLFCVTINGLAGRKIVSLDQGDYDILAFIRLVKKVGYRGPVGLQCYQVPGPSEDHLKRSMKTWQGIVKQLFNS